jgi:hypothetical protein
MEEKKETCPHCEKRKREEAEYEEMSLAVLLAVIPLTVLTLFGQIGLF